MDIGRGFWCIHRASKYFLHSSSCCRHRCPAGGAGHLVVDRDVCGSRDIPFHGGPGHGPEADRLDQPRGPGEAGAPQCKELLFTLPVLLFSWIHPPSIDWPVSFSYSWFFMASHIRAGCFSLFLLSLLWEARRRKCCPLLQSVGE